MSKRSCSPDDIRKSGVQTMKKFPNLVEYCRGVNKFHSITPTRLNNKHNLQMPIEADFCEVMNYITLKKKRLQKQCIICELHLTKDILVDRPFDEYITMLFNMSYDRLQPEIVESEGITSLYLHYNIDDSEKDIKFRIKFYDKTAEYHKRKNSYIVQLKQPLTQYEIQVFGKAYNAKEKTLNLENLNLLRCEIEFHEKEKLNPIKELICKEDEFLNLGSMIKLATTGSLYKKLNQAFINTLKSKVFTANETLEKVTEKSHFITKQVMQLMLNNPLLYEYKAISKELGYEKKFKDTIYKNIRAIVPNSELYSELCNKLVGTDSNNNTSHEVTVIPREQVIKHYNIHNSIKLQEYCLAYEVPIFDDS